LSAGGSNGLRMTTRTDAPSSAPALPSFRDRAHLEENHVYNPQNPQGNGDHWAWDYVILGFVPKPYYVQSPAVYTFTLPDASSVGTATLRAFVSWYLGTVGAPDPHYQRVYVNGRLVIDDPLVGNIPRQSEGAFAASALLSGTNVISYSLVLTGSSSIDAAEFNWFEVDYDHLYRAQNDYLAFGADVSGSVQMTVTNFTTSTLAVYDVTNPTNTVMITGAVLSGGGGGYALSFGDSLSASARYVAAAAGKAPLSVVRDTSPSNLLSTANGADEIFITGDDLYTATAPLESLRLGQGLRTMRVRISDVYDEFSDGVFDPLAIQRFLSYTYAYWQSPAPQYVLLVGNGNMNYRNFQQNNVGGTDVQLIPPFMDGIDIAINQAASDNHYVSFGGDNMPYMAIGRLPVRTVSETNIIISKILSYEQAPTPGDWRRTVDFFADNYYLNSGGYDQGGDFYTSADNIETHIPNAYTITRAYYCPDPCPPNTGHDPWYITETVNADPVHVRYAITTALSTGALFATYVGHGSAFTWGNSAIFYNAYASPLLPRPDPMSQVNNGPRMPIVLELACVTGEFYYPGLTTLAQSWLVADGRGAIADWASTGLSLNGAHEVMANDFFDGVFVQHLRQVGLAINFSKTSLVGQYPDLVDEFTLFGDPATTIQLPLLPRSYLPIISR
jgi:Peptidase family C25